MNTNADPALAAGQPGDAPPGSGMYGHHHHHGGFAAQSQSDASDPFANLFGTSAQDGSSTTATNADGSTTTNITSADGSEVTLTTPVQASNGNASPTAAAAQPPLNSNNFLETVDPAAGSPARADRCGLSDDREYGAEVHSFRKLGKCRPAGFKVTDGPA